MRDDDVFQWLVDGDVSVAHQAWRDLRGRPREDLQARVCHEGWGAGFLDRRRPDGHWGQGFYSPKWTSTHYTLLDLRGLEPDRTCAPVRESIALVLRTQKGADGGINPSGSVANSDVCINGMFLRYACYFAAEEAQLESVVDFVLEQVMDDGGFNCRKNRSGARHSSVHSTLSVLEGIREYLAAAYRYRASELAEAEAAGRDFLLAHRLFKSDRTGEIIHPELLRLSYPHRWKYNILRALDYFRAAALPFDPRMADALDVLVSRRRSDGRWPLQAAHPGAVHFRMEEGRNPSRWNTLLALRILSAYATWS